MVSDPLWFEMLANDKHIHDATSRPGPCVLRKRTLRQARSGIKI